MNDVSLGLAHEAEVMLRKFGATRENFWIPISKDEELAWQVIEFVSGKSFYSVFVDYGMSVEKAVKRGKYDWVNNKITQKNFPTGRTGKADVEIRLFHFNRSILSEDAIKGINRAGYRPVEIHEFLALGGKYPDLQRKFSIIAPGSVCVWQHPNGECYVPCLSGDGSKRELDLNCLEHYWNDNCRFAAVRKSKK